MTTIIAWLMAAAGPLAIRVLLSLGFTSVTFTGVVLLLNSLIASAQAGYAGLPVTVLQLASLSGVGEFLGMVFGALVARTTFWVTASAVKYVLKGA